MKGFKKYLVYLMISLSLLTVSCGSKEITVIGKFIELQSNPKEYGKAQRFNYDTKIKVDLSKELPQNEFNLKNVKSAAEEGDKLVHILDQNRGDRERRYAMQMAYENMAEKLVPIVGNDVKLDPIAVYSINDENLTLKTGNLNEYQEKKAFEQFEKFKVLIPKEWRKNIVEFNVEESKFPFAAYITYSEENPNKMKLGVNLYFINTLVAGYTMIHEFGHAFSMDESQRTRPYSDNEEYFSEFKEDAYMRKFFNDFWTNVPKNWIVNTGKAQKDVDLFYKLNRDKYISAYAISNVYEDFAESFSSFVLEKAPFDSTKKVDEKLKFFYQYPELVLLRLQILKEVVKDVK